MRAIANLFETLSAALNRVALLVAVAAVAVMLGAAGWQVVARYALSQPPAWTEELARFSMVWGGLMGASCAFHSKADPTLFPEASAMSGSRGRLLLIIRSLGVLAFILPTLWFCFFGPGANPARGYIARLAGRQAETMNLPMMVFGIAIPIAFGIILVHVLAELTRGFAPTEPKESV